MSLIFRQKENVNRNFCGKLALPEVLWRSKQFVSLMMDHLFFIKIFDECFDFLPKPIFSLSKSTVFSLIEMQITTFFFTVSNFNAKIVDFITSPLHNTIIIIILRLLLLLFFLSQLLLSGLTWSSSSFSLPLSTTWLLELIYVVVFCNNNTMDFISMTCLSTIDHHYGLYYISKRKEKRKKTGSTTFIRFFSEVILVFQSTHTHTHSGREQVFQLVLPALFLLPVLKTNID